MNKKKIHPDSEIGKLSKVFEYFNSESPYEELSELILNFEKPDISYLANLLNESEGENQDSIIYSFSKSQVEMMFINLIDFMTLVSEEKINNVIKLRYRKYLFRVLYVFWQNNYENEKIKKMFLTVIDNPKTSDYVDEINFSIKNIRRIVSSKDIEHDMIELSRQESLNMKEFLYVHKIYRKSILGIDLLSVFFLFCSAQDYIDFGSERLLVAIKRYEAINQAKTLNNMMKKLDLSQRKELEDVINFLIKKYPHKEGKNSNFWAFVSPEAKEILQNEI